MPSGSFSIMNKRASFRIALPLGLLMTIALLGYALLAGTAATAPARAQVVILSTTDLHGHIYPIVYYTTTPDGRGLAKLATAIKQARKDNPDLLLLDSGDTIQGTPLEYI